MPVAMGHRYDPQEMEAKWYAFWEQRGLFGADAEAPGPAYCITIPPPNVTGSLHIGHALQHCIHDILIRWRRMCGDNTLCVPGTDHAGIPTQMLVERQLAEEGVSRHELGREEFIRRMWQWRERHGGQILRQLRTLGCSYDWSRERFTLDEGYVRAVLKTFVEFYRRGWIYRGVRVINWCPRCRTALSDLEVEHQDQVGSLWHIRYPGKDGAEPVVVATTRPETMLGDTAVAVHPSDERYRQRDGEAFILPLLNRELPLVKDHYVDPEFGTGAVKVTPAHDPNDFEIGQRHDLPHVVVIDEDGKMTEVTGKYAGMDRFQCREAVVADLKAQGLLVGVEDHEHAVGVCARCKTTIEPLLSEQWFVSMKELAAKNIAAIREGQYRYVPERFARLSLEWLENIRDWCISRQIWWGHRIPVWQCDDCRHYNVAETAPDQCESCGSANLTQDDDVLDTWFSSALWPFAVLGWPDETAELKTFYPTSVLITARDILYLWVVRMVMTSLEFVGRIPFHQVYVHPTILNWEGRRMSKSLGTGVDPLELTDRYGADGARFGLIYQCTTGQDVRFAEEVTKDGEGQEVRRFPSVELGRNFGTKLWNAARFVLMNLDHFDRAAAPPAVDRLSLADRWILSRHDAAIQRATQALERYDLDVGLRTAYEFVWNEYCDWYLELSKQDLNGPRRPVVQWVLYHVLERSLRLLHPYMPFVTEEIWQHLTGGAADPQRADDSLMVQPWPQPDQFAGDQHAEAALTQVMEVVRAVRNMRAEMNLPPTQRLTAILVANRELADELAGVLEYIRHLARAEPLTLLAPDQPRPQQALSASAAGVEVFVPLEGLVDIEAEVQRLQRQMEAAEKEVARSQGKLNNEKFVQRAPAEVVEKERARLAEHTEQVKRLRERLQELSA